MIKLQFLGAARTVTGSCYLVDTGRSKFLVDCGLFQGGKEIKERNYGDFPFEPKEIDFVLLTHAHIDHSGLIPKLYKHGFSGSILATGATVDLCSILLPDSAHIQEMEVERKNRKRRRAGHSLLNPIYTVREAQEVQTLFRPVNYDEMVTVSEEVQVRFRDAGHILGSAMVEVWIRNSSEELKLVFSGDIGNYNQPIINDPTSIEMADYVVMESTYGSRIHQSNEDKLEELVRTIEDTFNRGGNLIIPAFAVERTQDLLLDLNLLIHRGVIKPQHVYIDSPLAIAATEIFCKYPEYYDQEARQLKTTLGGQCPLYLPGLRMALTTEESKALNSIQGGAIIISASGMCDAGRIKHHLKHNLWRPECTVLFIGYQAEGTLGRRLLEGAKKVRIHGEEIAVRAEIRSIEGFSAHADQPALLNWVRSFKEPPRKIFVTHGEEASSLTLAQLIKEELGIEATVPQWKEVVELPGMLPEAGPAEETWEQAYRELQQELQRLVEAGVARQEYGRLLADLKEIKEKVKKKLA
ncbi:MBL fold metallo-hydrolase RNA specificity domain-containing protein [Calderihabitans maritimus]|uniref:Predicted exonuclease of the beta-lactamase fold n=1 Tax=Calderihabitans maritimus TaxID=1246530 RepID=A0A1Z5HR59_9FIRM|nr:MBL fold metallo-hydrolase [Calderihabitans maritimus]GAW91857.1 predicted exonuclease of the beta-lactamase fold [Calderihabitans maritimus]